MFGVNLRLKKPMACACVAGGIGSAVAGFFGCRAVFICIACTHDIVGIYESCLCSVLISLVVAFGLAFVFTMMVAIPDLNNNEKEI